MKNIKRILAIATIMATVIPSTSAFASTSTTLVDNTMTKDEMIQVANENNLNLILDEDSMINLSNQELEEIINNLYKDIGTRKVDGETHVKRYKSNPVALVDSYGKNTSVSVYVTVVFDMYQDMTGKSITAIRSVTSDVNNNGISGCKFEQDEYKPKPISPTNKYTINGKGNLIRGGAAGQRVTFSLAIGPTYGEYWE